MQGVPKESDHIRQHLDAVRRSNEGAAMSPELIVKKGQVYRHSNNELYLVTGIANEAARADQKDEYPTLVSYERLGATDGKTWAKSPEAFLRSRTLVLDVE